MSKQYRFLITLMAIFVGSVFVFSGCSTIPTEESQTRGVASDGSSPDLSKNEKTQYAPSHTGHPHQH